MTRIALGPPAEAGAKKLHKSRVRGEGEIKFGWKYCVASSVSEKGAVVEAMWNGTMNADIGVTLNLRPRVMTEGMAGWIGGVMDKLGRKRSGVQQLMIASSTGSD